VRAERERVDDRTRGTGRERGLPVPARQPARVTPLPGTTNAAATIRCNNEKNYMGITIELFIYTPVTQRVAFDENGDDSGTAKFYRLNAAWDQCRNGMVMSAHAKYAVVDKNEQSTLVEKDSGRVTVRDCP
jgi:hypothetical protein